MRKEKSAEREAEYASYSQLLPHDLPFILASPPQVSREHRNRNIYRIFNGSATVSYLGVNGTIYLIDDIFYLLHYIFDGVEHGLSNLGGAPSSGSGIAVAIAIVECCHDSTVGRMILL